MKKVADDETGGEEQHGRGEDAPGGEPGNQNRHQQRYAKCQDRNHPSPFRITIGKVGRSGPLGNPERLETSAIAPAVPI